MLMVLLLLVVVMVMIMVEGVQVHAGTVPSTKELTNFERRGLSPKHSIAAR